MHSFRALAALAGDGTLSAGAWRAVLGETRSLPDDAGTRVIDHMVKVFARRRREDRQPWTPAQTRAAVRAAIHTYARDEVHQAREEALKGR